MSLSSNRPPAAGFPRSRDRPFSPPWRPPTRGSGQAPPPRRGTGRRASDREPRVHSVFESIADPGHAALDRAHVGLQRRLERECPVRVELIEQCSVGSAAPERVPRAFLRPGQTEDRQGWRPAEGECSRRCQALAGLGVSGNPHVSWEAPGPDRGSASSSTSAITTAGACPASTAASRTSTTASGSTTSGSAAPSARCTPSAGSTTSPRSPPSPSPPTPPAPPPPPPPPPRPSPRPRHHRSHHYFLRCPTPTNRSQT